MAQLTEVTAGQLEPAQAADLARVFELQAAWENVRGSVPENLNSLRDRQRGYDAFRSALAAYTSKHRAVSLSEVTQNTPERLGDWCRVVRTLFLRAGTVLPVHTLAKAHRLVDRIAARLQVESVERGIATTGTLEAAVGELGTVILWCEVQAGSSGPLARRLLAA